MEQPLLHTQAPVRASTLAKPRLPNRPSKPTKVSAAVLQESTGEQDLFTRKAPSHLVEWWLQNQVLSISSPGVTALVASDPPQKKACLGNAESSTRALGTCLSSSGCILSSPVVTASQVKDSIDSKTNSSPVTDCDPFYQVSNGECLPIDQSCCSDVDSGTGLALIAAEDGFCDNECRRAKIETSSSGSSSFERERLSSTPTGPQTGDTLQGGASQRDHSQPRRELSSDYEDCHDTPETAALEDSRPLLNHRRSAEESNLCTQSYSSLCRSYSLSNSKWPNFEHGGCSSLEISGSNISSHLKTEKPLREREAECQFMNIQLTDNQGEECTVTIIGSTLTHLLDVFSVLNCQKGARLLKSGTSNEELVEEVGRQIGGSLALFSLHVLPEGGHYSSKTLLELSKSLFSQVKPANWIKLKKSLVEKGYGLFLLDDSEVEFFHPAQHRTPKGTLAFRSLDVHGERREEFAPYINSLRLSGQGHPQPRDLPIHSLPDGEASMTQSVFSEACLRKGWTGFGSSTSVGNNTKTGFFCSTSLGDNAKTGMGSSTFVGDNAKTGFGSSTSVGDNTKTRFCRSTFLGDNTRTGFGSVASLGDNTRTGFGSSTSLGDNTKTGFGSSTSLGGNTETGFGSSTSVGENAKTGPCSSTSVGVNAKTGFGSSASLGDSTKTGFGSSTSVGNNTKTGFFRSTSLGDNARTGMGSSTFVGDNAKTGFSSSTSVGDNTKTSFCRSTSLGDNTRTGFGSVASPCDNTKTGFGSSTSLGDNTKTGFSSVASLGDNTKTGFGSVASLGDNTKTGFGSSTSLGNNTKTGFGSSTSLGDNTKTAFGSSTTVGENAKTGLCSSTFVGEKAKTGFGSSASLGDNTKTGFGSSTSLGDNTKTGFGSSTSLGDNTKTSFGSSTSVGENAKTGLSSSTSVGANAKTGFGSSTSVGDNTKLKPPRPLLEQDQDLSERLKTNFFLI